MEQNISAAADHSDGKQNSDKYILHVGEDGFCDITMNGTTVYKHPLEIDYIRGLSELWAKAEIIRPYIDVAHPNGPEQERGEIDGKIMITYAAYVARDRAQMESEFENYRKEWERSEAMLALKDVMALITKQIYIDDVVNFGLGSLHTMTEEGRKDSGLQTAALLTIMDCIYGGRDVEDHARCFSQDPQYSEVDKEFLTSRGIEPVDDPEGFSLVDDSSMFCNWGTPAFISRIVSEGPWPAAMVNVGIEHVMTPDDEESFGLSNAERQRLRDMVHGFEKQPFPQLHHTAGEDVESFEGFNIYWRKPQDTTGGYRGLEGS